MFWKRICVCWECVEAFLQNTTCTWWLASVGHTPFNRPTSHPFFFGRWPVQHQPVPIDPIHGPHWPANRHEDKARGRQTHPQHVSHIDWFDSDREAIVSHSTQNTRGRRAIWPESSKIGPVNNITGAIFFWGLWTNSPRNQILLISISLWILRNLQSRISK